MTREEAIKILNTVLFFGKCDCPKKEIEECLKMAIKALEQEPILDKIREIVDEWQSDSWTDNLSYECMIKIAEIIDKYKAEMESEE